MRRQQVTPKNSSTRRRYELGLLIIVLSAFFGLPLAIAQNGDNTSHKYGTGLH